MKGSPCREIVGALMCVATMTRPDIANAFRAVGLFCENPGVSHKKAVENILQYALPTVDLGVTYGGQRDRGVEMWALADSGFAISPDRPGM